MVDGRRKDGRRGGQQHGTTNGSIAPDVNQRLAPAGSCRLAALLREAGLLHGPEPASGFPAVWGSGLPVLIVQTVCTEGSLTAPPMGVNRVGRWHCCLLRMFGAGAGRCPLRC